MIICSIKKKSLILSLIVRIVKSSVLKKQLLMLQFQYDDLISFMIILNYCYLKQMFSIYIFI